jgi:long-subunit acyl-CoA synthetase (AMP-forming)
LSRALYFKANQRLINGTIGKTKPVIESQLAADGEFLIHGNNFPGSLNTPEQVGAVI